MLNNGSYLVILVVQGFVSFDAPATGKIAIKVINHYGDEVLKVFTNVRSIAEENLARPEVGGIN